MNLLYVYGGASPAKYREYVENKGMRISQQAQKYNQLLMEGLAENGCNVFAVSSRPINRAVSKKLFFRSENDIYGKIHYHYVPFVNYPILRNLSVGISTFFHILLAKQRKKETMVVCDALAIAASLAAWMAAKLRGMKTAAIVTDVPCHRPFDRKPPLHERVNLWLMRRFDRYLLLTEQMNEIVNPKNNPYIVLEGHADSAMAEVPNTLEEKTSPRIILYAGSLRRIYGIENLVQGYLMAKPENTQLHIYGDGDYVGRLKEICEENPNVKYMGIAPNHVVVEQELRASLLVNPRPTNEDYTKYSFPSKNMEYMASGTSVLTTKLPGMPSEYYPYVYLLEEETPEGVCQMLKEIFALAPEALHQKGIDAKKFILTEKSHTVQAKRVINTILWM